MIKFIYEGLYDETFSYVRQSIMIFLFSLDINVLFINQFAPKDLYLTLKTFSHSFVEYKKRSIERDEKKIDDNNEGGYLKGGLGINNSFISSITIGTQVDGSVKKGTKDSESIDLFNNIYKAVENKNNEIYVLLIEMYNQTIVSTNKFLSYVSNVSILEILADNHFFKEDNKKAQRNDKKAVMIRKYLAYINSNSELRMFNKKCHGKYWELYRLRSYIVHSGSINNISECNLKKWVNRLSFDQIYKEFSDFMKKLIIEDFKLNNSVICL